VRFDRPEAPDWLDHVSRWFVRALIAALLLWSAVRVGRSFVGRSQQLQKLKPADLGTILPASRRPLRRPRG
jgi:hypothetical protein